MPQAFPVLYAIAAKYTTCDLSLYFCVRVRKLHRVKVANDVDIVSERFFNCALGSQRLCIYSATKIENCFGDVEKAY